MSDGDEAMAKADPIVGRIRIPTRFRGPTRAGNGGYSCGRLAAFVDGPVRVILHRPVPLERDLAVRDVGDAVELYDGDERVATAAAAAPRTDGVPRPPELDAAHAAAGRHPGYARHPMPQCFTCGPDRDVDDALRVFPGYVGDARMVAAPWIPTADESGDNGVVADEIVWAVLDCPGGFAVTTEPAVLGTLTAQIEGPVRVGEPHVVVGWPRGRGGRRRHAGTALFHADGTRLAVGEAVWVPTPPMS